MRGVMLVLLITMGGCAAGKEVARPLKVTAVQKELSASMASAAVPVVSNSNYKVYWRPDGVVVQRGDDEIFFWLRERPGKGTFPYAISEHPGRGKERGIVAEKSKTKRILGGWRLPVAEDVYFLQEACRHLERLAQGKGGPSACAIAWAEGRPNFVKGVEKRQVIYPLWRRQGEICAEYDTAGIVLVRKISKAINLAY